MWIRALTFAACFALATTSPICAQRGGGGRGGGVGGPQGQRPATGQPGGPLQGGPGLSEQQRQRIRATDKQREQFRVTRQAVNRIRTRARAMTRAAKAAAFSLEQCRAQYVELASELQLMQQEHERLMAALSDEQRAATQDRDPEIDKELKELDVWIEAMDDELMESTPDPKQLARQSRKVEETAKQLEKDFRQLASDLSAD